MQTSGPVRHASARAPQHGTASRATTASLLQDGDGLYAPAEVIALGEDAEVAAALFATATGRPMGRRRNAPGEIDVATCAVVLTTARHATIDLLETLFGQTANACRPPGLIFARDGAAIAAVAANVAARLREPPASVSIVEIFATLRIGEFATSDRGSGRRQILGDDSSAETLRAAVTEPSAILTLATHSNGYDLYLGGGLSLCDSVEDRGRARAGAPCCHFTGDCFRQSLSRVDAHRAGLIVTPPEIRSRILVLYTCSGILSTAEGRDWGYAQALLGAGHVAAIIVVWSLLVPVERDLETLLDRLYAGSTVGEAVGTVMNQAPLARLAILGDPSAALPASARASRPVRPRFAEPVGHIRGDAGRFLHALCSEMASDGPVDVRDLAELAASRVLVYERAANRGHDTDEADALAMRLGVLAVLGRLGPLMAHHWLPLAVSPERFEAGPCTTCGTRTDRLTFRFRSPAQAARELRLCPRCGILRDAVLGHDLDLSLDGETLVLEGTLPRSRWSALLHIGAQARALSVRFAWPADERGAPERRFEPPEPWPDGPVTLAVFLVAEAELAMVTTFVPFRGANVKRDIELDR